MYVRCDNYSQQSHLCVGVSVGRWVWEERGCMCVWMCVKGWWASEQTTLLCQEDMSIVSNFQTGRLYSASWQLMQVFSFRFT